MFLVLVYNRVKLVAFLFLLSLTSLKSSSISAYCSWACFTIPGGQPYIETYFTFVGKTLAVQKTNGGFRQSVNVNFTLYNEAMLVKAEKYNVIGPIFTDSLRAPSFINSQRYYLANGIYTLQVVITDNNRSYSPPHKITGIIEVKFKAGNELQCSSIQALESYSRTQEPCPLTKSGFDLVPYTVNYYPETTKELAFYFETYKADNALGLGKTFVYNYYLETSENNKVLGSYGAFKKQTAAAVNPLLAKIDIRKLGSGNYNLVIELKDETNTVRLQKKYYFQRLNKAVDIVALQKQSLAYEHYSYFGNCNNTDTLRMFVECLWPIANGEDKERIINQSLRKTPELMKKFVVDFWERRAADTANPIKLWSAYYHSVQQAMALFKCGKQPGYYADRGRVFLQYGPPNQRSQQVNEPNTYPYEIWQYYRANDASNGQFFSNRKFVFVSRNLGDDCYKLVHSDMRGEVNNPRWRFEVTRNSTNGLADPDNEMPGGVQNNQFNEIYSNPR